MSKSIIVRIQSAEQGTKRIQAKPTERLNDFLEKVKEEFGLPKSGWTLYQNREKTVKLDPSRSKTLASQKIKHGDMVYLSISTGAMSTPDFDIASISSPSASGNGSESSILGQKVFRGVNGSVVEDDVDQQLDKQDGRIFREKNEQLCRHGPQGKCVHCLPLEPYDETYLRSVDPPIKFLSFHSYIRQLRGGVDKGKFANLENLSCKIKPGCKEHPPWPGGICTKCQPNAVTLNRQKFRHVDYIQFENPFLMERFLNYWRNTGNQRIGYMYGRYESHKDMPLGIKAVVSAIYEPKQISEKNSVELLEDEHGAVVDQIAEKLGLRRVGWLFTDLVALDLKTGTVRYHRGNIDTHFLSAEECIMAADFQNRNPNPCKLSPEGHFGSKYVTVVVTGDSSNQIHFEGYQVSDQCMALVRDDCLVPTKDAPEYAYVKESSNEQYVPDVFYKLKDKYQNEVTQLARPLPVEYLLLDMPAAFPVEPSYTFHAGNDIKPFPIENRELIGDIQDFNAFTQYIRQFTRGNLFQGVSDFHVLIYMATCDMLPLKDQMDALYCAVKDKDEEKAHHWFKSEEWGTVQHLMEASLPVSEGSRETSFVGPNAVPLPPIGAGGAVWTCQHCTFINPSSTAACEMCSLPKA